MRKNVKYAVLQKRAFELMAQGHYDEWLRLIQVMHDMAKYLQNPTIEDIELGAFSLKMSNILLYELTANQCAFMNHAKTTYKGFRCAGFIGDSIGSSAGNFYLDAKNIDNSTVVLRARDNGVGVVEVGALVGGATPFMRVGNATFGASVTAAILNLPAARPPAPVSGDTRYDAATDTFEIYDGAVWNAH